MGFADKSPNLITEMGYFGIEHVSIVLSLFLQLELTMGGAEVNINRI